jgi:ABC-2 type transport system permease protein
VTDVRAAVLIAANDLRRRLRDRSAILVALVIPFALAAIFGLTLGGVAEGDVTFDYALADLDRGEAAGSFRGILGELEREGLVRLRPASSAAEAGRLAGDDTVAASFVLPAGLSDAVARGGPGEVDVLGSPDAPLGRLVARAIASSWAEGVTSVQVAVAAAIAAGASRGAAGSLASAASAVPAAIAVADVSARERELDPTTFYAAGMAIFFLFFSVQMGVSSLLEERRDGTLARLLAAPIPPRAILAGKVLTSVAIGIVSMTALVVATTLFVGASWGDPLGVAVLVVCGVLAATAVAALVTTVARTPEQAGTWQSVVALVLGMLGGAFFPVDRIGGVLGAVSLATPHAWFSRGLTELTGGAGASAALPAAGVLLAFAAVVGSIALLQAGRLVSR